MATATVTLARGLANTPLVDMLPSGLPGSIVWSNVDSSGATVDGTDPIDLMLQILTTIEGNSANGSYDTLSDEGMGLGIPSGLIDTATFTDIQAQADYDTNLQVFFAFDQVTTGKQFIEDELCKPFGYYIATAKSGKLKLVRPKHPMKFHVSGANDALAVSVASGGTTYTGTMTAGIYNPTEMASHVQTTLNALAHGRTFTCTYDTGTNKFTLSIDSGTFDIVDVANDKGWEALGFTTLPQTGASSYTSATAVGAPPSTTLDKNDLWDIQIEDTREMQVAEVVYEYNYNWESGEYQAQRWYIDAEAVNLGAPLKSRQHVIKSKGLIGGDISNTPWSQWVTPISSCAPTKREPSSLTWLTNASWPNLFAAMLLDRYRIPPIKFKAKLRWEFNTLEVGDNVLVTYDIPGVFVDRELNADTLTSRVFEVIEVSPDFRNGYIHATFLGHRATTTTSASVTVGPP